MTDALCSPSSVSRRAALRVFGASAVALAAALLPRRLDAAAAANGNKQAAPAPAPMPVPTGPLKLPELPYAYDALEPAIDAVTMELHYKRHHQAYINNANLALKDLPEFAAMAPEEILRSINRVPGSAQVALRNNVGGHVNHSLFWEVLTPGGPKQPPRSLDKKITADFGSFDEFVRQLSGGAIGRFGSGWGWLVSYRGKLSVISTANQDSPLMDGYTPVAGIDVWEHAYYLKYQNHRPEYVRAVLGLLNWDKIAARVEAAGTS